MHRRDFLATGAAALVLPLIEADRRRAGAAPALHRRARHPQLRRVRRRRRARLRHRRAATKFVKRIPTWSPADGQQPENVKGVAASARTGRLYVSTIKRSAASISAPREMVWSKELDGGCDRMAISPDGKILYVPSFEGPHWNVVDAMSGDVITKVVDELGRAQHDLLASTADRSTSPGLRSPMLSVADTRTHTVVKTVGPFRQLDPPVHGECGRRRSATSTSTSCSDSRSATPDRPEAAPRRGPGLRARVRSSATAARATASG